MDDCLLAVSLHDGRTKGSLWNPFYAGINPIQEGSTLNYLPKAQPPNTVIVGVRFQHVNLGVGDKSIQSIALSIS